MPFTSWRFATFFLLLSPGVWLVYGFIANNLGANPVETLTHQTGKWAFICLLVSLAITPARQLTGVKKLMLLRRMVGLYAFFYATLHFLVYWVFDQSLSVAYLWEDISDRPYITLGFLGWLLLLPLAITSTQNWRKRLGKRWLTLHKLTYAVGLLALFHYIWLIRADYSEVVPYATILVALLGYRVFRWLKTTQSAA
ncbi:sulfite oxidase heme-binding subunit YedZ [Teredinibacter turnerae]|uniref:sulfite oxidase heme-binding subunit YedZ n=1 Tax=Teredinibacter turnerae TaxID=2426 RepID=UPI000377AF3E|nr:protein-methionine-sulfoxide reductase heme-binding subunit MsrQ [Teredinibacter turnerae]